MNDLISGIGGQKVAVTLLKYLYEGLPATASELTCYLAIFSGRMYNKSPLGPDASGLRD